MSAGNILDTDAIASGTTLPTIRSSHAEIRRGRSGSRLSHPGSVAPKDLTVSASIHRLIGGLFRRVDAKGAL